MNNSNEETPIPQYIAERMAHASVDVIHRHPKNAVIASVGQALVPVAERYSASYGALATARTSQSSAVEASREATEQLGQTMTAWLGPLARDISGFDPSAFGRRPDVALDVLSDGRRLIEVVQTSGAELSYREQVLGALEGAVDAAEAAHEKAQNARIDLQDKQAETRRLVVELQPHLVALRRVLRAELGTRHHDYQRLRVERARSEIEEDGESESGAITSETTSPTPEANPGNGHSPVVSGK